MREIKFRQRNINNGKWHYWGLIDEQWINPIIQDNYQDPSKSNQYTGLKDKHEKEIYEGDYCKLINANGFTGYGYVQFNDGCFDILFKEPLYSCRAYHHRDYLKCWTVNYAIEIIGTIHDNPEMMEVEND
jgi:uncharacterized phage protein (TIGR01671 family)